MFLTAFYVIIFKIFKAVSGFYASSAIFFSHHVSVFFIHISSPFVTARLTGLARRRPARTLNEKSRQQERKVKQKALQLGSHVLPTIWSPFREKETKAGGDSE